MQSEPDLTTSESHTLSRRSLIAGGVGALAWLLTGCSSDSNSKKSALPSTTTINRASTKKLALAQMFDARVATATPLRLPIGLVDSEGAFVRNLPATISARVGPKGSQLGPSIELVRRDQGLERAYFPLITTLSTPGPWIVEVTAGNQKLETTLTALEPSELPARVVQSGEQLPAIVTPTKTNPLGVTPLCTAKPPCPLHEISLDKAMSAGRPIALLVSSPAFCQTSICGPVLDLLLDQREAFGSAVTMIHIEVYTDSTAKKTTDTLEALGLTYEPSLFLAAPDGTLSERLDFIYDTSELVEGLERLVP